MLKEIQRYIDLRLEELKLKVADGISGILSLIITIFIVTILSITLLALISFAVMGWLNRPDMLGQPWGTVISIGILLLVLVAVAVIGRKVFPRLIRKALLKRIDTVSDGIKDDLQIVKDDVMAVEERVMNSPVVSNMQNLASGLAIAVASARKLFQMFK